MSAGAQWSWEDDAGKFMPFDALIAKKLETAFQNEVKTLTLKNNGHIYTVDFGTMTQTNTCTRKMRFLKRATAIHSASPDSKGTSIWQWQDSDGQWLAYSPTDAAALESHSAKGVNPVDIAMRGWMYTFDFVKMTQQNKATFTVRPIRCLPKPGEKRPMKSEAESSAKKHKGDKCKSTIAVSATTGASAPKWNVEDSSVLWRDFGKVSPCTVVYGFDLDSTLVTTRSGSTLPKSCSDWKWLFPEVPTTLKQLHSRGKRIVIFSNQGAIGNKGWDGAMATMVVDKIDALASELEIPLFAFIAAKDDKHRIPSTNMWEFMVTKLNGGNPCDQGSCMYIGNSAGRPAGWMSGRKKDSSCSDRKFAFNVGIKFNTPEEFFLKDTPATFDWDGAMDPRTHVFDTMITSAGEAIFHKSSPELVVFCGLPAAGKSTFAQRYFLPHGYVHVNRDTLKTPKKCYQTAKQALKDSKSCVIDHTMPKFKSDDKDHCNGRDAYIALAKKYCVPCRLFHFQTSEDVAQHLNYYRERLSRGKEQHVPRIGFTLFKKEYEEPKLDEGWTEIKKINFVPQFSNAQAKVLFEQFA